MAIIYDTDQPAHHGNHYDSPGSYNPRFNGSLALLVIVILLLMLFWGDLPWLRRNLNAVLIPPVQGSITRPSTDIRYVTADNLNLREEPSPAARASYLLRRGTQVALLGESHQELNGDIWLRVRADTLEGTQVGWVNQTWLRRNLNTVSRPAVQGSITRPLTNIRYVTADNLDLRDEPSQNARASYVLPRGTKVVLLGKSQREHNGDVWLKVRIETLEGSQVGWVSQQYVE